MDLLSKEQVLDALIDQRKEIESHIENGESNELMRHLAITDHKVFKEYKAAASANRMDEDSKYDLLGYTVLAENRDELSDHVLGMCDNPVAPGEKITVTAADLSKAYLEKTNDTELLSCPFLAPPGMTASAMMQELDKELGIDTSNDAEVLKAMENATDSMEKVSEQLGEILQSKESASAMEQDTSSEDGFVKLSSEEDGAVAQAKDSQTKMQAERDVAADDIGDSPNKAAISQAALDSMITDAVEQLDDMQEQDEQDDQDEHAAFSASELDALLDAHAPEEVSRPTMSQSQLDALLDAHAPASCMSKSEAFDPEDNDSLQQLLDECEYKVCPKMHEESKAFHAAAMSAAQANGFRQAGNNNTQISEELLSKLERMCQQNEAREEALQALLEDHTVMAEDYKRQLHQSNASQSSLMKELNEHRDHHADMLQKHDQMLQEHQAYGRMMEAKASHAQLQMNTAVDTVKGFFSKLLADAGHPVITEIEREPMALEGAEPSAVKFKVRKSDGAKLLYENDGITRVKTLQGTAVKPIPKGTKLSTHRSVKRWNKEHNVTRNIDITNKPKKKTGKKTAPKTKPKNNLQDKVARQIYHAAGQTTVPPNAQVDLHVGNNIYSVRTIRGQTMKDALQDLHELSILDQNHNGKFEVCDLLKKTDMVKKRCKEMFLANYENMVHAKAQEVQAHNAGINESLSKDPRQVLVGANAHFKPIPKPNKEGAAKVYNAVMNRKKNLDPNSALSNASQASQDGNEYAFDFKTEWTDFVKDHAAGKQTPNSAQTPSRRSPRTKGGGRTPMNKTDYKKGIATDESHERREKTTKEMRADKKEEQLNSIRTQPQTEEEDCRELDMKPFELIQRFYNDKVDRHLEKYVEYNWDLRSPYIFLQSDIKKREEQLEKVAATKKQRDAQKAEQALKRAEQEAEKTKREFFNDVNRMLKDPRRLAPDGSEQQRAYYLTMLAICKKAGFDDVDQGLAAYVQISKERNDKTKERLDKKTKRHAHPFQRVLSDMAENMAETDDMAEV